MSVSSRGVFESIAQKPGRLYGLPGIRFSSENKKGVRPAKPSFFLFSNGSGRKSNEPNWPPATAAPRTETQEPAGIMAPNAAALLPHGLRIFIAPRPAKQHDKDTHTNRRSATSS